MASDYEAIRVANELRYGTDVAHYGKHLLMGRYDNRTQFVLELLQNAEDALRRRKDQPKSRTVSFSLSEDVLRIAHYGKPFDTADVEGICGIARGTKQEDVTQIGQFGIGFKSVYSFTGKPRVYSGDESFGIESFVRPVFEPPIERPCEQTVFIMPLQDPAKHSVDIANGLRTLGPDTLLFLRQIDAIRWTRHGGGSGSYRRTEELVSDDTWVRRVTVIGESTNDDNTTKTNSYLLFSKQVYKADGLFAGHVEIAFLLQDDAIVPTPRSPLVVFFPTVVETHLGFRVQGPYRTTLSRDSVLTTDAWNQQCVDYTGDLLVDALVWLRDNERLDVNVLQCLPLAQNKFSGHNMFSPLYNKIKHALANRRLLPVCGGGHRSSRQIRATQSPDLRDLFRPQMLTDIYDAPRPLYWLSGDITDYSTPELRRYLRVVLGVADLETDSIIRRLTASVLEQQAGEWIRRLYEFMSGQRRFHDSAKAWPLVRLHSGKHVAAWSDGHPQAYLPGSRSTDFPTVKPSVCSTEESRSFLKALGLTEPDPVEDVIRHVLPKYTQASDVSIEDYTGDIHRIIAAFEAASQTRRERLISELRGTSWLLGEDAKSGDLRWTRPEETYVKTVRLAKLFEGVSNVLFANTGDVDGGEIRTILEACGAAAYLRRTVTDCTFSEAQLSRIRKAEGLERCTSSLCADFELLGLNGILKRMADLSPDDRRDRAMTLWEALGDLATQVPGALDGWYHWRWSHAWKRAVFPAAFVRRLKWLKWVPADDGEFDVPSEVSFGTVESLGWQPNPLLQSKILFRSPAIDQLADEVDIDVDVLRLLKKRGLTRVEDIRKLLGDDETEPTSDGEEHDVFEEVTAVVEPRSAPVQKDTGSAERDGLRQLSDWWNDDETRTEVISSYEKAAWPAWLRDGIADGLRRKDSMDHWLALLTLGVCRGLGRTRDYQHRDFLDLAHTNGWWDRFKVPDELDGWMNMLRDWQDRAQAKLAYPQWMSLFPAIHQISRYWPVYADLLKSAEERPANMYQVTTLLAPRVDEATSGAGTHFEAPPAPLNMGLHWVLRELVRLEVVGGEHLFPHCWVPSEQVLRFLQHFGLDVDRRLSNPEKARRIFDFMASKLETTTPTLHRAFDIPLRHVAGNKDLRRRFGLEE